MVNMPTVAICQPSVIFGGRLRVIIAMVEVLNDWGIIPDILTTRLSFDPSQLEEKYGKPIKVNYRFIPRIPKIPYEFSIALFNWMLRYYGNSYDLLINTSNSLIFLPENKKVMTYMFYPRKSRIMAEVMDIHRPDVREIPRFSTKRLEQRLYRLSKPRTEHRIICMTEFTRATLKSVYDISIPLPVIYPPVDIDAFRTERGERERAIVTLGRFTPSKRQLEQIKLAQHLSDIRFHITGFVNDRSYYQQCEHYVKEQHVGNVQLHPDAPFSEVLALLQRSKYFLHTLINEPFGITAVQAVAAGCLPIVHDSGGQRETVPVARLRYKTLLEVPGILDYLDNLSEDEVTNLCLQLQKHAVENFDTRIFYQRIRQELGNLLEL